MASFTSATGGESRRSEDWKDRPWKSETWNTSRYPGSTVTTVALGRSSSGVIPSMAKDIVAGRGLRGM